MELHLSHNLLTDEGVAQIVPAGCQGFQRRHRHMNEGPPSRGSKGNVHGLAPLWLRLEQNLVRWTAELLDSWRDQGLAVCSAARGSGCSSGRCKVGAEVHLPYFHFQCCPDDTASRYAAPRQRVPPGLDKASHAGPAPVAALRNGRQERGAAHRSASQQRARRQGRNEDASFGSNASMPMPGWSSSHKSEGATYKRSGNKRDELPPRAVNSRSGGRQSADRKVAWQDHDDERFKEFSQSVQGRHSGPPSWEEPAPEPVPEQGAIVHLPRAAASLPPADVSAIALGASGESLRHLREAHPLCRIDFKASRVDDNGRRAPTFLIRPASGVDRKAGPVAATLALARATRDVEDLVNSLRSEFENCQHTRGSRANRRAHSQGRVHAGVRSKPRPAEMKGDGVRGGRSNGRHAESGKSLWSPPA